MFMNWLPQGALFNSAYFNQEISRPLAAELQGESGPKSRPRTLLHMDSTKPHTSKANLAIMEALHFKRTAQSLSSPAMGLSDFFLFG
jgi:hypothetical protein